ncbi:hypothetical protein GCM10010116_56910 [Microbispora rosea subsp. aerata]|nr:hypothetical protein GCM10010116_56910 [Microbispora rosea subsp. aerata]GIH58713.1 hypothetical protein Mro02_56270 [Microbispora rosea subsp. aerata]GLJ82426.1 hypothetical protein GCM10017588_11510 [Microbispora rosea subsp. aerata]
MKTLFDMRGNRRLCAAATLVGAAAVTASLVAAAPAPVEQPVNEAAGVSVDVPMNDLSAAIPAHEEVLLQGSTTGSYFWDDASGRQGDTGLPAIGKPMQKGLFASPSWPLGTEGYVFYKGKKAKFFIGDRGPGIPSDRGVMLDIDGKTFAELTGTTWNEDTLTVSGDLGHIPIQYVITKWGDGPGLRSEPVPFSSGAWRS